MFIKKRLNMQYGSLEKIVTNNAQNFNDKMIGELYAKGKIKHSNSSPYRLKMKSIVETTSKNVKKVIQKMVITYKD